MVRSYSLPYELVKKYGKWPESKSWIFFPAMLLYQHYGHQSKATVLCSTQCMDFESIV
jgi:hypothetical protein